jgi:hypothetical protein
MAQAVSSELERRAEQVEIRVRRGSVVARVGPRGKRPTIKRVPLRHRLDLCPAVLDVVIDRLVADLRDLAQPVDQPLEQPEARGQPSAGANAPSPAQNPDPVVRVTGRARYVA